MNKREREQQHQMFVTLQSLGFTYEECEQLRRISMTLRRWHEMECGDRNGMIERDETTGVPYWFNANARYLQANDSRARTRIADREKGALKRLGKIIAARNGRPAMEVERRYRGSVSAYIQGDPRGASLYIIRPGDVPAGKDVGAYYTRGICVY